jgi:hypothetical protein
MKTRKHAWVAGLVASGFLVAACGGEPEPWEIDNIEQEAKVTGNTDATISILIGLGYQCTGQHIEIVTCKKCYKEKDGTTTCVEYTCRRDGPCDHFEAENQSHTIQPSFTGLLHHKLNKSLCIHKIRADWMQGTDLHLWACDQGAAAQKTWHYDAGTGLIHANGNKKMCWHKERLDWRNGQRVHLWDCGAGGSAQKTWIVDPKTGQIHSRAKPSMCVTTWRSAQGEALVLRDCGAAGWQGYWETAPQYLPWNVLHP